MSILKKLTKYRKKNDIKTLFLVDILYMKDINAVYGFDNGDYIIKQLKKLLNKTIKNKINTFLEKSSFIEFVNTHVDVFGITIYKDLTHNEIEKIKDLIFNTIISHKFSLIEKNSYINIDITMGCSKSRDKKLKIYAEKALHSAKINYVHFIYLDSTFFEDEKTNENLLQTLKLNIQKNLVEPYFQPIANANTEEIEKYEALMRVFDENGNIIMPHVFIHKAKKYRLYNKLMGLLIEKVILYIEKYQIHISLNIDFHDILNPELKELLFRYIKNSDIGKYITLEILESDKISNYEVVNDFIKDIKKHGVKIAIDDFGTGFSNYEYILNIDVDYIKIDGSLIKKIDQEIYLNLVKSIVLFCKQQNIQVIAEFVSDLRILRYIRSLGIDYAQGYHISKPKPIEEIVKELNEKNS
ncbi:hypothetical protein CPU12_06335 [Malaciobacter molluscorum LMG 25693]|uniref:Diguanylate phosphodiesterase n=1 Tax=Malaciobacter molluscorum LMG 25693 TaxID=870501 RepID=A0A2G1DIL1_9BACT|nr:EAL domain-containing protein [Malaciobacter molluscorum]AXX91932.1 diguanylate phosphodiesterase [Malaciobacter molluscorum LMG 25693]PHO18335.1 hypothetical protein CPU12_06335 [Malaciobacter molluscorum LMG 25693]RXJ94218.1 hypothetical protein CRV00_08280 [Malaciobacter molluscorum]